ncbi:unnamed protein product [Rotaria socialis]
MLIFSDFNLDSNNTVANNSSLSNTLENIENSTSKFLSLSEFLIFNTLLVANTSTNSTIETVVKPLLVSHTASKPEMNAAVASLRSIVNQMNSYRHNDILFRIKHCDSNMKLSDICETYTVDNTTNLLIRQSNIDFQTLQHVSNVLVDRIVVQKLSQLCLSTDSYLTNLSESNIRITHDIVRERGNSFCSLQQCHSRLQIFVETCPTLSNKNVSITTLELLPMLCALHNEQIWSSAQCTKAIVYLLHIVYAFWAQVESNKRRLGNDNYEYTRFHDSSFELGANTEISNASAASNSTMTSNEIEFGANDRFDSFEYHRLLREES